MHDGQSILIPKVQTIKTTLINERRAFGERLRRQRERQQVTLAEIAETTKVAASLFAGLERGDCSRWPGGFYSRSFIRGYAEAVELDPAETAAEFAEYYDAADAPAPTPASSSKTAPHHALAPLRLGLDTDPTERYRRATRRAGQAVADLVLIVALAYLVRLGAGMDFWVCLSVTSLAYHFVGRVIPIVSPVDQLLFRKRQPALEPATSTPEGDAPVGGAASTVA